MSTTTGVIVRPLWRRWRLSAALVLVLALGQATTVALFVITDGVLMRPFPVRAPEQLFVAAPESPFRPGRPGTVTPEAIDELRRLPGVVAAAGFKLESVFDDRQREEGGFREAVVTEGFFDTLGVPPARGRSLHAADGTPGDPRRAVIGHGLWRDRFGEARDLVGRVVTLGGRSLEVVGVMPPGFDIPNGTNVWFQAAPAAPSPIRMASLTPVLRVRGGVLGRTTNSGEGRLLVESLRHYFTPSGGVSVAVLFASALLGLMIAWVHLGAVQVGFAIDEWRDLALRSALGASRRRLAWERAAQCLLLTVAGGVAAHFAVPSVVAALVRMLPPELTLGQPLDPGPRSLAFLAVLSVAGGACLALGPVFLLTEDRLSDGIRGGARVLKRGGSGLREVLLAGQVALVTAILYLAAVYGLHFLDARHADLGLDYHRVAAIELPATFTTAAREEPLLRRVRSLPFVRHAALGQLPLDRGRLMVSVLPRAPRTLAEARSRNAALFAAHPGYFRTLGIRILHGQEDPDRAGDALYLSRALASSLRIDETRIGTTVYVDGLPSRVAGIVSDVRADETGQASRVLYAPSRGGSSSLVVSTRVPVVEVERTLAAAVAEAAGTRTPPRVTLGSRLAARLTAPERSRATLLGLLGLSSLVLGIAGVFSTTSEAVKRRARDTAIRLALGASASHVVWRQLKRSTGAVLWGLAAGLGIGVLGGHLASSLTQGVQGHGPLAACGVVLALLSASLLAALGPAVASIRIDIVNLVRSEAE